MTTNVKTSRKKLTESAKPLAKYDALFLILAMDAALL